MWHVFSFWVDFIATSSRWSGIPPKCWWKVREHKMPNNSRFRNCSKLRVNCAQNPMIIIPSFLDHIVVNDSLVGPAISLGRRHWRGTLKFLWIEYPSWERSHISYLLLLLSRWLFLPFPVLVMRCYVRFLEDLRHTHIIHIWYISLHFTIKINLSCR